MQQRGSASWRGIAVLVLLALCLVGAAAPDDPLVDRQYHLRRVRAYESWDVARGLNQVIAVLDTGVDLDHPDLKGKLVRGVDLVDRNTPPDDKNGHGTFVAGIAVATMNNDEGGVGVAPRAKVMPIRVLDDEGKGTSDVVADGIRWATREGATVINLSLADVPGQRRPPTALITTDVELAIRQAVMAGVTVVAAAGNEGENSTPYSQDLPALIVGATTRRDQLWEHSNFDDRTLFAPGVGIVSTYVGTPYAAADGTSFSAPIVAAGAALLRSKGRDDETTRRRLYRTARPVGKGVGRVDLAAALGVAKRVRSEPAPPKETESEEPPKRKPKPVTQPSPIAEDPPRKKPVPSEAQPKPPKRKVAAANPKPTKSPRPTPAEVPSDEGDGTLALGPDEPPGGSPAWPLAVAGALLFGVVVGLAGYVTSRRSG